MTRSPTPELMIAGQGLPVLVETRPHHPLESFLIFLRSGSRHEGEHEVGATHLMEHLLANESLVEDMEAVGAAVNAVTSKEYVAFFATVPVDSFSVALDRFAEAVLEPRITATSLESEVRIIEEEIRSSESDPSDKVFEVFMSSLFQGQGLGRPTAGSAASINELTVISLQEFHRKRFHSGLIGIVGVGGIGAEEFRIRVEQSGFGRLERNDWTPSPEDEVFEVSADTDLPSGSAFVVIGSLGVSYRDVNRPAMDVWNSLIGGAGSSRLVKWLRRDSGLCYEIWSEHICYSDTGVWFLHFVCDASRVNEAIAVARKGLKECLRNVDTGELQRAKQHAIGELLMKGDSTAGLAMQLGTNCLVGQAMDWDVSGYANSLARVDGEQTMRLMSQLRSQEFLCTVTTDSTKVDHFSFK